ncbi:MAG: saccharopine dehydrogenase family protein [Armatimonadota bacterium]
MRILVLGCGLQGRAALHDLARSDEVKAVVVADSRPDAVARYVESLGSSKFSVVPLDASDAAQVRCVVGGEHDVVIDLLPRQFIGFVGEAAVDAGVHLVNTYYDYDLRPLSDAARSRGVTLLPECGMDPGIDLVLAAEAARRLDEVHALISYGAGFPEPSAANNPLKYKISWTFEGVLNSYYRSGCLIQNGQVVEVSADEMFAEHLVHILDVPGLGQLEAFPNGDAAYYAEKLGLRDQIRDMGRYTLRWPGHCRLWKALVDLGFLSDDPVPGLPAEVTPRRFLAALLEPQLQYAPHERDVALLRVEARGLRDSRERRLVLQVIDYRDLETGLFAMNRTVGYTASIVAQMIGRGEITEHGLLSPLYHVPYESFTAELARRGITVTEEEQ